MTVEILTEHLYLLHVFR